MKFISKRPRQKSGRLSFSGDEVFGGVSIVNYYQLAIERYAK